MSQKSNNSKGFKIWPRQQRKKTPKDILSEADDIISNFISKTECNIDYKSSKLKTSFTGIICLIFAIFIVYMVIRY